MQLSAGFIVTTSLDVAMSLVNSPYNKHTRTARLHQNAGDFLMLGESILKQRFGGLARLSGDSVGGGLLHMSPALLVPTAEWSLLVRRRSNSVHG